MIKRIIFDIDGTLITGVDFSSYVANTCIDPSYFTNIGLDMGNIQMNSNKTMIASKSGILFKRKNVTVYYLKANNWAEEQNHIQQVFSDISCNVDSSYVFCDDSDSHCSAHTRGSASYYDPSDSSSCGVDSGGSALCD